MAEVSRSIVHVHVPGCDRELASGSVAKLYGISETKLVESIRKLAEYALCKFKMSCSADNETFQALYLVRDFQGSSLSMPEFSDANSVK